MLVEEIAALYNTWVDVGKVSWHASELTTILKVGYNMFRLKVIEQQPMIYAASADIAVSGYTYDLRAGVVSVLGATPTNVRMEKALELRFIESNGRVGGLIKLMADPFQIMQESSAAACLRASKLEFNFSGNDTFRFWYVAESIVNWTKTNVDDDEFVDDLSAYHELIAMYAAEYYGIRDGASPRLQGLKRILERSLIDFLFRYQGDQLEIGS